MRSAEASIEKEALKVRMLCLKLFQTLLSCIDLYISNTQYRHMERMQKDKRLN